VAVELHIDMYRPLAAAVLTQHANVNGIAVTGAVLHVRYWPEPLNALAIYAALSMETVNN
jgi:hypothetical protein